MKKSVNQTLDGDATERNALTRKLYRYISEAARRVDEGTARANAVADLFIPSLEVQRQKLRENCQKLILADPLLYGRKAQELLWRKGYYEVVAATKRLRAPGSTQEPLLLAHIEGGIGHYHHLIFLAQADIEADVDHLVDYPQIDKDAERSSKRNEELIAWGKSFVQSCLIYLGDLSRYKTEYEELWDPSMAFRYYSQAAAVDPRMGAPYNQLGTLYTGKNYHLDSVRYYILCMSRDSPFEGCEGNLIRIFDKNSKQLEGSNSKNPDVIDQQESVKLLICKFLSLVDCWFFEKDIPDFNDVCAGALYDLKECLQFRPLVTPDQTTCHEEYVKYILQNEVSPEYMNPKLINKFVIIILLCVNKLQKDNSPHLFPLKAFTFAVLSQLLQKLQSDLVDIGFQITDPTEVIENYKEKVKKQRFPEEKVMPVENGFHNLQPIKVSPSEEKEEKVISKLDFNMTQDLESISVEILTDVPDENSFISNGVLSPKLTKTDKIKSKKSSILQKLRRRRRRIDSFDSSDKTGSEDLSGESDDEARKSDHDSSTSDDDNASVDTYSSPSTSDDEQENSKEGSLSKNDKSSVESSHSDLHNKDENVPENETRPETEKKPLDIVETVTNNNVTKEFDEKSLMEFLENDNILMALRLLLNWLHGEVDLIVSCGPSGRGMFQTMVDILNTVHRQIFPKLFKNHYSTENQFHPSLKPFHELFFAYKYTYRKIPLVEDYEVRSLEILEKGIAGIEWANQNCNLPTSEANAIRLLKFLDFGIFIVKLNVGIVYNKRLKLYLLKKPINKKTSNFKKHGKIEKDIHYSKNQKTFKVKSECVEIPEKQNVSGGSLMKNLGRLWLSEQVRALESEVSANKRPQLPAYLVLDAEALCQQTYLVKQIVASKKVIVLIPTIVLQTIDALKKESVAARSAIRWLELQLRNGSRFIRTQRITETAPVPCVKYPKKMHRDVQNFIQIIEFCHFFLSKESPEAAVNGHKYNGSGDVKENINEEAKKNSENLVVLLTGSDHSTYAEQKDFSYSGLAQTAGVGVESIQEFCLKWKHCFGKGGRKR